MLRSNWRFLFAFVGVVLSGANHPKEQDQQSATSQELKQVLPALPPPTYKPYPRRHEEACYQAADHDTADLCAQWTAADAAKEAADISYWGNWIGAIGAVLSFASVLLVLIALRQGRRANEIAKEGSYRDLRAYLSIGVTSKSVDREILSGHILITNAGQTPAHIRVFVGCWIGEITVVNPAQSARPPVEELNHHPYINRGGTERVRWFFSEEDDGAPGDIAKVTDPDDADWALMVYGRVEFTDFNRRERILNFSYRNAVGVLPGGIFEMVPTLEGNHYQDKSHESPAPQGWRNHLQSLRDWLGAFAT